MPKKYQSLLTSSIIFLALAGAVALGTKHLVSQHNTLARQSNSGSIVKQVALVGGVANPNTLTIKVGESVQFNTKDGQTHELALGEGGKQHDHEGSFESGEFGANEAWRASFKKPGTYFFHDHFHPDINILIVAYK